MTDDDANVPTPGAEQPPADEQSATTGRHAKADGGDGVFRRREWGHIRGTRIRTSTAAMVVVFLGLLTLYGWTSQHYGVVAPAPQPTRTHAPSSTTPSYTYSTESRSRAPSVSRPSLSETPESTESGETPTGNFPAPVPDSSSSDYTIPGVPGVTIPRFGEPATTTPTETTPRR